MVTTFLNSIFLIQYTFVYLFGVYLGLYPTLDQNQPGKDEEHAVGIALDDNSDFRQRRWLQVMVRQGKKDSCVAVHIALSARAGNMFVVVHCKLLTFALTNLHCV